MPKDQVEEKDKCGMIYLATCDTCKQQYVGETARSAETKVNEYLNPKRNPPTAIQEHLSIHKHKMQMKSFSILTSEPKETNRRIKEAIQIKKHQPTLNRDTGLQLAAVYDDVLSCDHSPPGGHMTQASTH